MSGNGLIVGFFYAETPASSLGNPMHPLSVPCNVDRRLTVQVMDPNILLSRADLRIPSLSTPLWRYLDIPRFVSLLDGRCLHFIQASIMEDTYEGSVSGPTLASRHQRSEDLAHYLTSQLGSEWTAEMTSNIFSQDLSAQVMLSCWHMNEYESAAMWKLYCPQGDGVAIRTTAGKLILGLPATVEDSGILASEVIYVDYDTFEIPEGNIFWRYMHKRMSFSHEQEFRAFLLQGDQERRVFDVPMDLEGLIDAVHLPPRSAAWKLGLVRSLLDHYGVTLPVVQSRLDAPALR